MAALRFKQVDVFTQKPFLGNPVAVVLDADGLNQDRMQSIAAWTNLSETTFVLAPSTPDADYRVRIFTPKQELPFAGHPTLGSAHAVIESGVAIPRHGKLRQECVAGIVDLFIETTSQGNRLFLETPQAKLKALDSASTADLAAAVGAATIPNSPALRIDVGVVWLIADLGNAEALAALTPEINRVQQLSMHNQAAGITVFGRAHSDVGQIHVRSFAPALGVTEDPVCGSGNAGVAAYLLHTGLLHDFGVEYSARQGMQLGRDGVVAVRVQGNAIRIGGYAVTCVDGNLRID